MKITSFNTQALGENWDEEEILSQKKRTMKCNYRVGLGLQNLSQFHDMYTQVSKFLKTVKLSLIMDYQRVYLYSHNYLYKNISKTT